MARVARENDDPVRTVAARLTGGRHRPADARDGREQQKTRRRKGAGAIPLGSPSAGTTVVPNGERQRLTIIRGVSDLERSEIAGSERERAARRSDFT
jgi:hypothetical protein